MFLKWNTTSDATTDRTKASTNMFWSQSKQEQQNFKKILYKPNLIDVQDLVKIWKKVKNCVTLRSITVTVTVKCTVVEIAHQ